MLENVVKRSEFVYTREQRYTKVIYYYYYYPKSPVDPEKFTTLTPGRARTRPPLPAPRRLWSAVTSVPRAAGVQLLVKVTRRSAC